MSFPDQGIFKIVTVRWPMIIGNQEDVYFSSAVSYERVSITAHDNTERPLGPTPSVLNYSEPCCVIGVDAVKYYLNNSKYNSITNKFIANIRKDTDGNYCHSIVFNANRRINEIMKKYDGKSSVIDIELELLEKCRQSAARAAIHGYAIIGNSFAWPSYGINQMMDSVKSSLETSNFCVHRLSHLRFWDFLNVIRKERQRGKCKEPHYYNNRWNEYRNYCVDVYYTFCHGGAIEDDNGRCSWLGLHLHEGGENMEHDTKTILFTPKRFGDKFEHSPALVFINGCWSRQDPDDCNNEKAQETKNAWELSQKFNSNIFIGYDNISSDKSGKVAVPRAKEIGEFFFEEIKNEKYTASNNGIVQTNITGILDSVNTKKAPSLLYSDGGILKTYPVQVKVYWFSVKWTFPYS